MFHSCIISAPGAHLLQVLTGPFQAIYASDSTEVTSKPMQIIPSTTDLLNTVANVTMSGGRRMENFGTCRCKEFHVLEHVIAKPCQDLGHVPYLHAKNQHVYAVPMIVVTLPFTGTSLPLSSMLKFGVQKRLNLLNFN